MISEQNTPRQPQKGKYSLGSYHQVIKLCAKVDDVYPIKGDLINQDTHTHTYREALTSRVLLF